MMTLPAILAADFGWSELSWVVYGLLGVVGFLYVLVPLLILTQQKFEARPRMIRFEREGYEWPEEIDRLFTTSVSELEQAGFEVVDSLFLPSAVQNVKVALVLLVNRTEQDGAMVTAMYAQPVTPTSLKTLYVEFSSRYDDDFVYNTNNSTQLSAFPTPDHVQTYQFVKVKSSAQLYQVHQAIMQRDGRSRSRKVLRLDRDFSGDVTAFLQAAMREEFDSAAEHGYVRLTADGERFVPTVKGAYLMVWKELWPWKAVRKASRNQRAKLLLDELAREGLNVERLEDDG